MSGPASSRTRHREQRHRWSQFLDAVMPPVDPHRLVPVAEVNSGTVSWIEECLSDADLPAAFRPITSRWGAEPRYQVLVPADQVARAAAVVRGR